MPPKASKETDPVQNRVPLVTVDTRVCEHNLCLTTEYASSEDFGKVIKQHNLVAK